MGYYTEMCLSVQLKHDRPEWVDRTLRYMAGSREDYADDWPGWTDHPLFETERWRFCLEGMSVGLGSAFHLDQWGYLTSVSSIKDYAGTQEQFLDWLKPHIQHWGSLPEFVGWRRGEDQESPTLIYLVGDEFVHQWTTPPPDPSE